MLGRLRACARGVASTLLVSLAVATGSEALPSHAGENHDAACAALIVGQHEEAAHRLTSAVVSHSTHPLHCLVCHWARAFRPIGTVLAHQSPVLEARATFQFGNLPAPAVVLPAQLTLRSPPSPHTL
jgi:hypothetical protein